MTFENAWNELDLAMRVDYNERFNQADADDAALARAEAMAEAREQPKSKARVQPKAKAKVRAKAKAQAHPEQSARPHADALARAWIQEMPGRFVLVPGSSVTSSPAMGLNSSSSSAGGMGF